MRLRAALVTGLLLLVALPGPGRAWDALGHQVIARIAWESMSPDVRDEVTRELRGAPEPSGIRALAPAGEMRPGERARLLFQRAAVWADLVRDTAHRGHRYDRPPWHYVNFFWRETGDGGAERLPGRPRVGELVNRLDYYRCALPGRMPEDERGMSLAWLLHLVGDVHQPLHASARVTPREPEGDRGGNEFSLGPDRDLHGYWDGLLGNLAPAREDEGVAERAARVAARIRDRHPASALAEGVSPSDPEGWARESAAIARTEVYDHGLRRGRTPPPAYREQATRIAARRAALAGYRLAAWLEEAYGDDESSPAPSAPSRPPRAPGGSSLR